MEPMQTILDYTIFANSIKQLTIALGLMLFATIFKKLFTRFILGGLKKITGRSKFNWDVKVLYALEKPLEFIAILVGVYFVKNILTLPSGTDELVSHILNSLYSVSIFWILLRLVDAFKDNIIAYSQTFGKGLSHGISNFFLKGIKFLIFAYAFLSISNDWGYNVSGFVASLGLVGMAFALAAKDTAANFFGSITIFTDKPFNVGDWIETPKVEGVVEEIGIRTTKVRTFAQAQVTVANADLANDPVTNWSRMGKRRIKMTLGLTYSTTHAQMQNILSEIRELLKNDSDIHPATIFINFTEFQDSALGIFCYYFTNTTNWGEYMSVRERINLEIMRIVERNGSSFAYPSQSLYIEKMQ